MATLGRVEDGGGFAYPLELLGFGGCDEGGVFGAEIAQVAYSCLPCNIARVGIVGVAKKVGQKRRCWNGIPIVARNCDSLRRLAGGVMVVYEESGDRVDDAALGDAEIKDK